MADTDTEEAKKEEAAMVSEWEDMAEGAGAAPDDEDVDADADSRLLNQDEIDSLLGFDDQDGDDNPSGVMALINAALVNYERLPMLDIVFDRLVRLLSTSLRNLTSDSVEVTLDQVSTVRFNDYMNSIPLPAMLAVFKAEEWDNHGMMVVDSALIYSVVDVLLGGRKGTAAIRIEGRPYTTIEQKLIERMVSVSLSDLSSAFDPLSPVTFGLERMETNPRFATITQGNNACVLVRMRVDMGDRGGRMEVMIPYATLEPIRELLLQMFMGEKFGRDSIWETHLTKELYKTDVKIQAIMAEKTVPLSEILNWKKGSRVMFNVETDERVEMRCGDFPIFTATMGQKKGYLAARIDTYIDPKKKNEDQQ
ncbi:MAG: flagellar motor switch protein FliM [Micavibrio sp.]|nr:flagellar motor switch protein FliM [Micavibrio sp.]|tara:strand:- start:244 stop:1338 length:1095 start_codon:yes stop_codon:yes gene_type:complete